MKHKDLTIADLLQDESFQQWALDPNPELRNYWEKWMVENPDRKPIIAQAAAIIRNIDFKTTVETLDKEALRQQIKAGIRAEDLADELNISTENAENRVDDEIEETVIYALPQKTSYTRRFYKMAVAASLLLLATFGYLYFFNGGEAISHATGFGETKEITLPDGSLVHLNANSKLSFCSHWSDREDRKVTLIGEAYFAVVHTGHNQKFVVHSNDLEIEVLGTEFNVNNRRGKTQVVLESGKVKINLPFDEPTVHKPTPQSLIMAPGDFVEVSDSDKKITRRVADPTHYSSWRNGKLIFDAVPLGEVFEMIQDRYGYDVIVMEEGIQNSIFEAEIQSTDLDLIIRVIARSFNLNIARNENELIVKKN